jgi:wyosine [tRNA(Phe)-imidazoG37] synthetase (radical SAM superfamily)
MTNNYYCSQKFWWLTVELERKSMLSCCAATAHRIDLEWVKHNPGQLFNTPSLKNEREQMLAGIAVASCTDTCWNALHQGLPNRRDIMQSHLVSHTNIESTPDVLHINLGSDCNMTCSYCCKQYSTAWLHDINRNGAYLENNRYTINNNDRILLKLGQSAIKNSNSYQLLTQELQHFDSVKKIEITGGEPFLYNGLANFVSQFKSPINIYTGLGVNTNRLEKILDLLPDNVSFTISAENTEKLYEFNRYGNTWDKFLTNLQLIQKRFQYNFCSVISNLTIHGYTAFRQQFGTDHDEINLCTDPDYLSASVMDDASKQSLSIFNDTTKVKYTQTQKANLKLYLLEFTKRRNLSLDVFPNTFVTWLKD